MTLRQRLVVFALLALISVAAASAIVILQGRSLSAHLLRIFDAELAPAIELNALEAALQRIRTRTMAVQLGHYSSHGGHVMLVEDREHLLSHWRKFHEDYRRHPDSIPLAQRPLVAKIEAQMALLEPYLEQVDAAIVATDMKQLNSLTEYGWVEFHIHLIKPLQELIDAYEDLRAESMAAARSAAAQFERAAWVIMLAAVIVLTLAMLGTLRRIFQGLRQVGKGLAQLAENRYENIDDIGWDEIAIMTRQLDATARMLYYDREQIIALKNQNEAIVTSLGEGLYGTDSTGTITFVNPAGAAMLGWSIEELVGKPAHVTLHHSYRDGRSHPVEDCPLYHALTDGRRHESNDDLFWRRDGSSFDVRVVSMPLTAGEGPAGAVVSFADISKLKGAERELRDSLRAVTALNLKLEEAQSQLLQSEKMASIGQLAAGVAHEINNPIGFVSSNLGSLQTYCEDMLRLIDLYLIAESRALSTEEQALLLEIKQALDIDYLREDLPALLKESMDGLQRVKKIVLDLKGFSHVDQLEWQLADLNTGLDSTLNIVWNELKYKAEVVKEYGAIPPVECLAAQVNQVFMNLLVNAAQAIDASQHLGKIVLRSGQEGDLVWVEVEDSGQGMSEETQKRIFEPFYTTKPVGKGTGLGLSVSYNIAKKHGGSIDVTSTPGQGARFRLWLPVKRIADE